MRKPISLFVFVTVLVGLLLVQPSQSGYAQGQPTPSPTPYPGEAEFITFQMLGLKDEVMVGPYAYSAINFSTPDSWVLEPGAKLVLDIETIVRTTRTSSTEDSEYSGAQLEVQLNDQVVDVILLRTGQEKVEIQFPPEALYPKSVDGQHSLQLSLDATFDCLFDHETAVLIHNASGFTLPHHAASPKPDLTLLPKPIYKQNSLLPDKTLMILPDSPTKDELQSAMIIAASFGRMTNGEQILPLTSVSELTEEQKTSAHLIFVGKPASLPILEEIEFPATVTGTNPTQKIKTSDGFVQMAVSPWSTAHVVLYFGGAEDAAVVKAAQAFSSGAIRVGKNNSLSVISEVAEAIEIKDIAEDRSFASLGYSSETIAGMGYNELVYEFLIPLGKISSGDASLNLIYTHSATFDFEASSAVISLNGEALGSIRFSEVSANKTNTLNITIPAYAIRPGRNILTIETEFIPTNYCSQLNDDTLWMSVNQNSLLHTPLVNANDTLTPYMQDLALYPIPFINSPTLSNLSFIFPTNDSNSWELGAGIATDLGKYAVGKTLNLSVFYANDIPDEIYKNNHLIIVGQPSQLPIINEFSDAMPARFEKGSNMAIEDGYVNFSIPEGTDLGYLELFSSPKNTTRSVLAVLGSTPLGLQWSKTALLTPETKKELQGDYAVIHDKKIYAIDTKLGTGTQNLSATAVPGAAPTPLPDTIPVTKIAHQQDWVLNAIIITSSIILILLLTLAIRGLQKGRAKKRK